MSHHIAISGVVRCADSTDPLMSSIFLNFNVNAADRLWMSFPSMSAMPMVITTFSIHGLLIRSSDEALCPPLPSLVVPRISLQCLQLSSLLLHTRNFNYIPLLRSKSLYLSLESFIDSLVDWRNDTSIELQIQNTCPTPTPRA